MTKIQFLLGMPHVSPSPQRLRSLLLLPRSVVPTRNEQNKSLKGGHTEKPQRWIDPLLVTTISLPLSAYFSRPKRKRYLCKRELMSHQANESTENHLKKAYPLLK